MKVVIWLIAVLVILAFCMELLEVISMSRYSKIGKVARNGAVDSKYFGNRDKFEEDINSKLEATKRFKDNIKRLILEDPNLIEQRYFNTIEVLKDIKEEFGI